MRPFQKGHDMYAKFKVCGIANLLGKKEKNLEK